VCRPRITATLRELVRGHAQPGGAGQRERAARGEPDQVELVLVLGEFGGHLRVDQPLDPDRRLRVIGKQSLPDGPGRTGCGRTCRRWRRCSPDVGIEGRADARGGVVLGEAILRLVTALAGPRGAMLVLEDLHWADPDTLDVVSYLADAADSSPVVLVTTARDELDPPQRLLDLATATQSDMIPLDRLGPRDVRGVIEACLAAAPPDELVQFVVEHADGLPFLVEELLTGLAAVGALSHRAVPVRRLAAALESRSRRRYCLRRPGRRHTWPRTSPVPPPHRP
jgi:hypothetical protein